MRSPAETQVTDYFISSSDDFISERYDRARAKVRARRDRPHSTTLEGLESRRKILFESAVTH
jgi:hypothetical protein